MGVSGVRDSFIVKSLTTRPRKLSDYNLKRTNSTNDTIDCIYDNTTADQTDSITNNQPRRRSTTTALTNLNKQ